MKPYALSFRSRLCSPHIRYRSGTIHDLLRQRCHVFVYTSVPLSRQVPLQCQINPLSFGGHHLLLLRLQSRLAAASNLQLVRAVLRN